MALKVKARERLQKIGKYAGEYRYQLMADLYTALTQEKVIREAALRSGVSQGVMQACWDAAGEVIKAWATEGHSVALPGLGFLFTLPTLHGLDYDTRWLLRDAGLGCARCLQGRQWCGRLSECGRRHGRRG